MKIAKYFSVLMLGAALTSCGEDFLTDYSSQVATSEQIKEESSKDPEKALGSQLGGVYANWNFFFPISTGNIMDHMVAGFSGIMQLSDVMSNDCSLALGGGDPWHFDHTLDYGAEQYVRARQMWSFFYTVIKGTNEIIPMVDESIASQEAKAYKAQALALRGISYAYLAQFYQKSYVGHEELLGVPLLLGEGENSVLTRAPLKDVYARAEADLLNAIDLFGDWKRKDNTQIDRSVAQGFLSRVYLAMERYSEAAQMANAARQGYNLMTAVEAAEYNYQEINNVETMWGCDITDNTSLIYASFASWMSTDYYGYGGQVGCFRLIDAKLYQSIAGENDARYYLFVAPGETATGAEGWEIPSYANTKFRAVADWLGDVIYMRVAEMYLTEAEALARSGNDSEANALMAEFMANRVMEYSHSKMTAEDIYAQRRLELWGEGFSYFDHRRLKKDLMRTYEGTNEPAATQIDIPYNDYRWIFQIPLSEIQNSEYITEKDQNPYTNEEVAASVRKKHSALGVSKFTNK